VISYYETLREVEFVFVNQSTDAYMTDIEPDYSESELAIMQAEIMARKKETAGGERMPYGEGYRNHEKRRTRMHRTLYLHVRSVSNDKIMQCDGRLWSM
jgi:hypothetical protein